LWCDGSAIVIDGDNPYWSAGINKISTSPDVYAQPGRAIKRPYDESTAAVHHAATPYPGESIGFPKISLAGTETTSATVTHFEDHPEWTVAWMEWDDPAGTGATHEQRIYWHKASPGLLWIRNRIDMPVGGLSDVNYGHVIRAHDVHPASGAHWNAVFTQFSRINNVPVRNVERMAIVHGLPRVGEERRAFTIPDLQMPIAAAIPGWPPASPDCSGFAPDEIVTAGAPLAGNPSADCRHGNRHAITQVRIEPGTATGSKWFDTLLLPFDPDAELPGTAADRLLSHTLSPDGSGVELEVAIGGDTICIQDDGGSGAQIGFGCGVAVPAIGRWGMAVLAAGLLAGGSLWRRKRGACSALSSGG